MDQQIVDDSSIPDDALLLRRVPLQPQAVILDKNGPVGWRPSSLAFKDSQMSAFLASEASVDQIMDGYQNFALAAVTAKLVRDHGQIIVRRPADIPGHVEVIGPKSHSVLAQFARLAIWVRPPPEGYGTT